MIWMASLYSSVHILCMLVYSVILIHGNTGWCIFCGPHRIHNRQQTELENQPARPNGVLPPTERRPPRSDFPPDLLHWSSTLHPFYSARPIPRFQTIGIRHPRECLLVHGPHPQSFCSTSRDSRPAMGSRLHARLPMVQRPSEACASSTIFARGIGKMAHARCCRSCTRPPSSVSVPLLCGAVRLRLEHQHQSWCGHHDCHRLRRFVVCLDNSYTRH